MTAPKRPTVAYCLALIERQQLAIQALEARLKKVENSQFQREHSSAPVKNVGKKKKFVSMAQHSAAACKYHGKTSVNRDEMLEYIATLED